MGHEIETDRDPDHEATPQPTRRQDTSLPLVDLRYRIAQRPTPEPKQIAHLIAYYTGEPYFADSRAMFEVLHQALGNAYVQQVVAALAHEKPGAARR